MSSKKYKELESENRRQSSQIRSLELAKSKGEKAADDLADTRQVLRNTESELEELTARYNGLQDSYEELQQSYKEVLDQNKDILDITSREKSNLTREINLKEEALNEKEQELNEKLEQISESQRKIVELEARLEQEKQLMDSLQTTISNALFVFGPSDLSVEQRDGKIYVSLSQKLLFDKNSDKLDAKGKNALSKLAEVLKDREDLDVVVEGHTDVDGDPSYNWDLSTRRATTIVKNLQNAGVNPDHLTAAGRAFYEPVAKNDTEEGKSLNRRTEIILSPKMDQVMELFRSN
ncbi:OmpA family protein [Portibacter marinus]|uniref:OmpA family protein n=1 Tax=Portibacter marinus TaxID=2898660 RepID=UPI001F203E7E|nr:OmpA family protein [Portibacter marinus]